MYGYNLSFVCKLGKDERKAFSSSSNTLGMKLLQPYLLLLLLGYKLYYCNAMLLQLHTGCANSHTAHVTDKHYANVTVSHAGSLHNSESHRVSARIMANHKKTCLLINILPEKTCSAIGAASA